MRGRFITLQYDDARTQITTYRPNAPRAIGMCANRGRDTIYFDRW